MRRAKSEWGQSGGRGPMGAVSTSGSVVSWSAGGGEGETRGGGAAETLAHSQPASATKIAAAEEGRIIDCPGACLAARWSVQRLPRQAVVGGRFLCGGGRRRILRPASTRY